MVWKSRDNKLVCLELLFDRVTLISRLIDDKHNSKRKLIYLKLFHIILSILAELAQFLNT